MLRLSLCLAPIMILSGAPASAQIFWQPPDNSGPPLLTLEPGVGVALPGATIVEQRAALLWSLRSGLNVAALQCGFAPTLRAVENYNAIISNHRAELEVAFTTIGGYFKRTAGSAAAGQKALDSYGTKTYSSFSAVRGLNSFCSSAGLIGRRALFTPRGSLGVMATEHLRELIKSVNGAGEQQFRQLRPRVVARFPRLDDKCWKKSNYKFQCGWQ